MFARALGIDPGLVRTGWAVVDGSGIRPTVLGHGLICPPTGAELPARLAHGARELRAVVAEYRPEFVALEEVFTAPRHPRSALLMAHMRGAICLVLEEAGVPIVPLTATTVKQRLTSGGHASKEQVQRMVLRLTGLRPERPVKLDETDAIALALAALHAGVGGRERGGGSRGAGVGARRSAIDVLASAGAQRRARGPAALRQLIRDRQSSPDARPAPPAPHV